MNDRPKLTKEDRAARSAAWAARRAAADERRRLAAARDRAAKAIRDGAARRLAALPPIDPDAAALRQARRDAARRRDVIDVGAKPPKTKKGEFAPTPEQFRQTDFVEQTVFDKKPDGGQSLVGTAYRRRPKFETIAGLTFDQFRALRFYRRTFDESEQSEVKSQLDVGLGGGGGLGGAWTAIGRLEEIAFTGFELRRLEANIRPVWLGTLRAVALFDADFSQLAMQRYGSREVQRIDVTARKPAVRAVFVPISGRHREIVRQDFMEAVKDLTAALSPRIAAASRVIERIVVQQGKDAPRPLELTSAQAAVDPDFLDEAGFMRPWDEIRAIILDRLNAAE